MASLETNVGWQWITTYTPDGGSEELVGYGVERREGKAAKRAERAAAVHKTGARAQPAGPREWTPFL